MHSKKQLIISEISKQLSDFLSLNEECIGLKNYFENAISPNISNNEYSKGNSGCKFNKQDNVGTYRVTHKMWD